jgi:CheY-like chemotaxis protein
MWPAAPARPLLGLSVLLADDAAAIRQVYGDILRRAGAEVAEAADGAEAVSLWREAKDAGRAFDVVVLDYAMPELDGAEVAAHLRREGYAGGLVGISGEVSNDSEDRWRAAGCDRIMCKGLSIGELVSTVAASCGRLA